MATWKKIGAKEYDHLDGRYCATVRFSGFMWHWHPYYITDAGLDSKSISVGGGGCYSLADARRIALQDISRHKAKIRQAA